MVLQRQMLPEQILPTTRSVGSERKINPEEDRYLSLARKGEQSGYAYLLQQYRGPAVRLAAHVLRRPDEAEDVAQEAFVRAFRSLHTLRSSVSFKPWLCRIVVRVCFERQKLPAWRDTPLDDTALTPATSDNTDARLLVSSLLAELSPALRAALVLREMEGLSYEEVAQVLTIPVGTVRSRLSAARARFRDLYEAAEKETNNV